MNEKTRFSPVVENFPFLDASILQDRLGWSVKLRWLAIAGYFSATLTAHFFFDFNIPYHKIWLTLLILLFINLAYFIIQLSVRKFSFIAELSLLSVHIIVDLFFLSLLLHFSGGIENPIYFFYLFHVVLSSIVFPKRLPYVFSTLVVGLFFLLIYSEYSGFLPHYSLFNTNLYINKTAIELTLTIFAITVYVTTYICLTFMQIYRQSKRVIDEQNRKLRSATEQKLNFFRFASHELKSPIVAIKTSIDTVLASFGRKMDPVALNLLKRSSARTEQMLTIIKDLLELSKSREFVDKSEIETILPGRILEEMVAQETVLAQAKKIDIEFENDLQSIALKMAKSDLEKILRNLINNAVRYTKERGKIRITAKVAKDKILIKIRDTGIGIPEEDLPKIFDEFYRSKNARALVNFGSGLGLSLVKQIVEIYHGIINVQSELNKGSTFIVSLPINPNSGTDKISS